MKSKKAPAEEASQANTTMEHSGELGDIRVHNNVFSSLVRRAALSVDGVSRLAGSTLVDGIAEFVGVRRIQDRAITIIKDEKTPDQISVEVKIVLKDGHTIPETAPQVQKAVIEQVEKVTGMNVGKVAVLVVDADDPVQEDKDKERDDAGDDDAVTEVPMS